MLEAEGQHGQKEPPCRLAAHEAALVVKREPLEADEDGEGERVGVWVVCDRGHVLIVINL